MKKLLCTLILLSSFSAFAVGEERDLQTEGVMCQSELGKPDVSGTEVRPRDAGNVVPQ
tara:strand:+ start:2001 stop:2174 length:174 start_codon:yes stop_codon:yes gene_type:complete